MLSVMMMVVVMMTVTTTARSITMVENAGALHGEPRSVINHDLTDPNSRSHLPIAHFLNTTLKRDERGHVPKNQVHPPAVRT